MPRFRVAAGGPKTLKIRVSRPGAVDELVFTNPDWTDVPDGVVADLVRADARLEEEEA